MPVQHTLFGRQIRPIPPRKLAILLGSIALFAVFTLVFTLPKSIPSGPSLNRFTNHKIGIPKLPTTLSPSILNPFRQVAHAPPVQKNSTNGEVSWYNNWSWLTPFSSSFTLDENRSILPPIIGRPPIYTYYDHTIKKDQALQDAESSLLLTWRRAWWAQGFKPVILGPADAMSNPIYAELQMKKLEVALKNALSRWLAWENMGTGILCETLLFPMGEHNDPLLSYLRRGEYPELTRFDNLGRGLFAGNKVSITAAVKQALSNSELTNARDFISAVKPETFKIDPKHDSLAYYSEATVKDKYVNIADEVNEGGAKGLISLNKLILAHLHVTWQNLFSEGVAVLKPNPQHMTTLIEPAFKLAEFLTRCPESPMPSSCPPNRPRCKPCVSSTPLKLSTPYTYRNTSGLYTIGTVPHPYTMALSSQFRSDIDIPWIRRESHRDPWLSEITLELLGVNVSGAPRVTRFKDIVASPFGISHSLWITAEKDMPDNLDWHFGFTIPRNTTDGKSETPVTAPEKRPVPENDPMNAPVPNPEDVGKERALLIISKEFGKARTENEDKLKGAIEAWNLADMESWKFTRAFLARRQMERLKWEEEEKRFVGG